MRIETGQGRITDSPQAERILGTASNRYSWFCIHTKPRCEDFTAYHLMNKNVLVFNPKLEPCLQSLKRHKGAMPLFPSYIFAKFRLASQYSAVKWTPGVKVIISDSAGPIPVENTVINSILDRLERREYQRVNSLRPGKKVAIKSGVFKGLDALFEGYSSGRRRVRVLLALLSREIRVELDSVLL